MSTAKTSSKESNFHRKVKLASAKSRSPKNDGETIGFKNKGFRGNKNTRINIDDDNKKENGGRRNVNGGRRNVKSNTRSKSFYEQKAGGDTGFNPINIHRKRKRVYAEQDNSNEGMFRGNVETSSRRVFSKGWSESRDDVAKGKRTVKEKSHDFERFDRERIFKGERKSRETESLDNNGGKNLRFKMKAADKKESVVRMDRGWNSSMKKDAKSKYDSRKQFEQNHNGHSVESLVKSVRKKVQDKKSVGDDLAENDDQPMKSKRVIRIDPHDITNKRLDDGIVTLGHTKEKKEDNEKSGEMSKNAQFRAINPSPSILSFVEDNFLGRRRLIELRRAGYNTELSAPLDNIPLSTSLERERIEEPMFRNKLEFFAAANISSSFPPPDLPEIAFAGRSNVGKSSLLNALTRQWGVVRTSDKPGLTQTINFFKLGSKLSLVDLPGYGFAYAKEEVKEAWEELVKEYVSTRVGLKRVCLLVDTKWGMKPRDHELIDLMESSQTKYQIVLTKTDLVFPIDVARRAMQIEESLKAKKSAVQPVVMVSSKSGAGIRCLRTVLAKISRFVKL